MLDNCEIPTLTTQIQQLHRSFTEENIHEALMLMKPDKAPRTRWDICNVLPTILGAVKYNLIAMVKIFSESCHPLKCLSRT